MSSDYFTIQTSGQGTMDRGQHTPRFDQIRRILFSSEVLDCCTNQAREYRGTDASNDGFRDNRSEHAGMHEVIDDAGDCSKR